MSVWLSTFSFYSFHSLRLPRAFPACSPVILFPADNLLLPLLALSPGGLTWWCCSRFGFPWCFSHFMPFPCMFPICLWFQLPPTSEFLKAWCLGPPTSDHGKGRGKNAGSLVLAEAYPVDSVGGHWESAFSVHPPDSAPLKLEPLHVSRRAWWKLTMAAQHLHLVASSHSCLS